MQDLSICDEAFTIADSFFNGSLGVGFARMSGADQVHGNVRIDKNHKSAPLPYPLSISANERLAN
jgi:hypothetical protein